VAGGGQFPLQVVHREIAFAHGHSQIPNLVAKGSGWRAALRLTEEESAFFVVVAELVTEDAKSVSGIGVHQKVGGGESRGFSSKSRIPPTEHLLQFVVEDLRPRL
jgi:hypothetical protein